MSISRETMILTNQGLKQIKDIKIDDLIFTQEGYRKVDMIVKNNSKMFKIKTYYGLSIIMSEDQLFKTIIEGNHKNITIKESLENTIIGIIPGKNEFINYPKLEYYEYVKNDFGNKSNRLKMDVKFPEQIDEEFAYLLGYSYGDGHIERDKLNKPYAFSLACAEKYPDIIDKNMKIISKMNTYVSCTPGDGKVFNVTFCSKSLLNNFSKNGILKQKAGFLKLPDKVLYAGYNIQMAFISGFFDADGCSQKSKKALSIEIIDEEIILKFQLMLLSCGIISRIGYKEAKNNNKKVYRLNIVGARSILKTKELCVESIKISNTEIINKRDTVLSMYLSGDFNIPYCKFKYINNFDYMSYNSYYRLFHFENLNMPEFPIIQDKIIKIEEIGEEESYELITEAEGYFANGIYCLKNN